jgi:hypothetical protein
MTNARGTPTEADVRRVTRRLARFARAGEHGRKWYQDAGRWAKSVAGSRAPLLLRLLAATSPRASVQTNVRHARRAFGEIVRGAPLSGGFGVPANDANVRRVARGERIAGPKVRPFAEALTGTRDAVPVDVWMVRASGMADGSRAPTRLVDRTVRAACNRLAKRWGWEPREVQAAAWTGARTALGGDRHGASTYATAWRAS